MSNVHNPNHYDLLEGVTAIQLIASSMTEDEFYGYCLGNMLKYRVRTGKKDSDKTLEDLAKADNHNAIFNEYKHLCRQTSLRQSHNSFAGTLRAT